jgi:hypothetical protein
MRGGSRAGRPQIVDDPDLDDVLWTLATQDARDTLIALASGQQLPAAMVSTFNYAGRGAGRGGSRRAFTPETGWLSGPDGF